MTTIVAPGYADFLAQLKTQIRQRQYQALRAVNHELVGLYWDLGQSIHTKQSELGWGKAVVQNLASDLQLEFPGRNGFSARNLWNMLDFYRVYADLPKLQPLVAEISWAKNLVILSRCKDDLEREFYLRATARFGWTKAVLQHQVDNKSYQKYLLNQTSFDNTLPEEHSERQQRPLSRPLSHKWERGAKRSIAGRITPSPACGKGHWKRNEFLPHSHLRERTRGRWKFCSSLPRAGERPGEREVFLPSPACGRGAGGEGAHNVPIHPNDIGTADRREVTATLERHDADHLPDSSKRKSGLGALT